MKNRVTKSGLLTVAMIIGGILGHPAVSHAQAALTPQQEWSSHPNMVRAYRSVEAALVDMQRAPNDFGGNKARAMEDARRAMHSIRRAIFFRLKMDDAAIDAAQVR